MKSKPFEQEDKCKTCGDTYSKGKHPFYCEGYGSSRICLCSSCWESVRREKGIKKATSRGRF